ncbi:CLUMA_CG002470, isoform A [Clunio marinus]|uniref:CLUMA_CG002470, isoform A n=1 Tax=Clunio marinus TaxID=568069 RepID=A0A1J1HR53_9DIPT|nr:CLUMA_CG002470, isoform A [Clunio marinus]
MKCEIILRFPGNTELEALLNLVSANSHKLTPASRLPYDATKFLPLFTLRVIRIAQDSSV